MRIIARTVGSQYCLRLICNLHSELQSFCDALQATKAPTSPNLQSNALRQAITTRSQHSFHMQKSGKIEVGSLATLKNAVPWTLSTHHYVLDFSWLKQGFAGCVEKHFSSLALPGLKLPNIVPAIIAWQISKSWSYCLQQQVSCLTFFCQKGRDHSSFLQGWHQC